MLTRNQILDQIKFKSDIQSPAHLIYKKVSEYIEKNPCHSWDQIFYNVDNYYNCPGSLRAAMKGIEKKSYPRWSNPVGKLRLQII